MSLLVLGNSESCAIHESVDIRVYASGNLVGSGCLHNGACGIAVWGDDPTTEKKDGLLEGEVFELRLTGFEYQDLTVTNIQHGEDLIYHTDDFVVLDLKLKTELPTNYYLNDAYPNPFNHSTRLTYGLHKSGTVKIQIYDISGRLITTLTDREHSAGNYTVTWNALDISSGIYLVEMQTGSFSGIKKVMLVK